VSTRKIVGIGETVLDMVFRNNQPQAAVPGGSTFNAMISLGRTLGKNTPEIGLLMVSQLGDDPVADIVCSFMKENNVSTDGMNRIHGCQTTVSMALLDENNDAHYEFFRDKDTPPFSSEEMEFSDKDIVIFGSFFAVGPTTRPETERILRKAKAAGATIYYDINFRKNHLASLDVLKQYIEENCRLADVVRGSSEDIMNLWGSDDAKKIYDEHMSKLCETFICTKGPDSVEVFSKGGVYAEFPVAKLDNIASTIGAGDNFNAGFVYGIVKEGLSKQDVSELTVEDWKSLVPRATAFSANVCQSMFNYVDTDFVETL